MHVIMVYSKRLHVTTNMPMICDIGCSLALFIETCSMLNSKECVYSVINC